MYSWQIIQESKTPFQMFSHLPDIKCCCVNRQSSTVIFMVYGKKLCLSRSHVFASCWSVLHQIDYAQHGGQHVVSLLCRNWQEKKMASLCRKPPRQFTLSIFLWCKDNLGPCQPFKNVMMASWQPVKKQKLSILAGSINS